MKQSVVSPILYYHRVSPEADPRTGVTPSQFREQMQLIRSIGFVGTTLSRGLSRKEEALASKGSPIALTFDDGYEDNYRYAAPILLEFGFAATIFFVADRIGKIVDWTDDSLWGGKRLMDFSMAKELVSRGFEAGSHTLTHPDLAKIDDRDAWREISLSRERLSQYLSCPVTTFCYPFGSFRDHHPSMVREAGYHAARTVHRYRPFGRADLYRLACRPVSGRMGLPRFALTLLSYRLGLRGGDVS